MIRTGYCHMQYLHYNLKQNKYETVTSTIIVWVSNAIKKTRSQTEIPKELCTTLVGPFAPG